MANRRRIAISTTIVSLIAVIGLVMYADRAKRCLERAFQQSAVFGLSPRRFFSIVELKQQDSMWSYTYAIGLFTAETVITVSKVSCGIRESRLPTADESASFDAIRGNKVGTE